MNDFKNDFVSYELALALSELGFDEPCLAVYRDLPDIIDIELGIDDTNFEITTWFNKIENKSQYVLNTPTYRQAFKFFEDKYGLGVTYNPLVPLSFIPMLYFTKEEGLNYKCNEMLRFFGVKVFNTYEEAELACLNKLIEICKKQK